MASKHQAIYDWVAACPLLTDTLLFDFLSEHNGSVSLSPTATDIWVKQYVRGNGIKQYGFELQAMFAVSDSTDDTNISNMQLMQTWMNWLEQRQMIGDFPDFGPHCGNYKIVLSDSMPSQAMLYRESSNNGNMSAKYLFPATVQYYEENNRI